jgi:hypothetical protein
MAKISELREGQVGGPEYDIVPVTPEVATTWLRLNKSNRPLRQGTIARLARLMELGQFKADHPDHITFDEQGNLINGQHRLHAVIRSQTTQHMRVMRHVPREMAHVIDIGLRRSVEDSVWIAEGDKTDRLGLRLLTRFAAGGFRNGRTLHTREELIAIYERYAEALSAVANLFIEFKSGSMRACVKAAVARAWVARTSERKRIRQFVQTLCTGIYSDPDEDSAAMTLRDYIIAGQAKGTLQDYATYRKVNWSLGKFLAKEKVAGKPRDAEGEQFRIPEDVIYDRNKGEGA